MKFHYLSYDIITPFTFFLFNLPFKKIKEGELNEGKHKFFSFDDNSFIGILKNTIWKQYEGFSINLQAILVDFYDESFVVNIRNILKIIRIPKTKCEICYKSLFTKKCKFSKSQDGNCHLFHKYYLSR